MERNRLYTALREAMQEDDQSTALMLVSDNIDKMSDLILVTTPGEETIVATGRGDVSINENTRQAVVGALIHAGKNTQPMMQVYLRQAVEAGSLNHARQLIEDHGAIANHAEGDLLHSTHLIRALRLNDVSMARMLLGKANLCSYIRASQTVAEIMDEMKVAGAYVKASMPETGTLLGQLLAVNYEPRFLENILDHGLKRYVSPHEFPENTIRGIITCVNGIITQLNYYQEDQHKTFLEKSRCLKAILYWRATNRLPDDLADSCLTAENYTYNLPLIASHIIAPLMEPSTHREAIEGVNIATRLEAMPEVGKVIRDWISNGNITIARAVNRHLLELRDRRDREGEHEAITALLPPMKIEEDQR